MWIKPWGWRDGSRKFVGKYSFFSGIKSSVCQGTLNNSVCNKISFVILQNIHKNALLKGLKKRFKRFITLQDPFLGYQRRKYLQIYRNNIDNNYKFTQSTWYTWQLQLKNRWNFDKIYNTVHTQTNSLTHTHTHTIIHTGPYYIKISACV